jgi:hypothetical protein
VAIHESATILAATRQAVHSAGHTVALATTGKEGVERLKAAMAGGELPAGITGIDVLLVGVPGGEGAIEAARSMASRPVTVAACNGNAQEIVRRALEVGADLVTTRPHDDRLAPILFAAGRLAAVRRIVARAVGPMLSGANQMPTLAKMSTTPAATTGSHAAPATTSGSHAAPTTSGSHDASATTSGSPAAASTPASHAAPAERSDALRTMRPTESVGRPVLGSSPTAPARSSSPVVSATPPAEVPVTDGARHSASAQARTPSDGPPIPDGETVLRARVEALAEQEPGTLQPLDLFERILDLELKRVGRYGYPIAIAMFAVEVDPPPPPGVRGILRARAGNALVNAIRDIDLATELDHERFLVLLPYTSLMGAAEVGRRIIAAVAAGDPVVAGGKSFAPRVIGAVAGSIPGQPLSFSRLLKDADRALEQARRDGAELAVPMVRDPRDSRP